MSLFACKITPVDKWFSYFIRFRDNWTCQVCGKKDMARAYGKRELVRPGPSEIECMHLVSRANWSVRLLEENSISGCHTDHIYFTKNDSEWRKWCEAKFGQKYHLLRIKAKQPIQKQIALRMIVAQEKARLVEEVFKMAYHSGRLWIIEKDLGKKRIEELKARFPHPSNEIRVEYEQ